MPKSPPLSDNPDKLFSEGLLHLYILRNQIQAVLEGMKFLGVVVNVNEVATYRVAAMLWQLLIVHIQSYRFELKGFKKYLFSDQKLAILEIINTLESDINSRWPDLQIFRNQVVGHSYRDKDGVSLFQTTKIEEYRIPKTGDDFNQLAARVLVMDDQIRNEYIEIISKFDLTKEPFFKGVS